MPGLDELRKRVEAAEQHFGLITTQSRKYSERLTQLVSQMEQAHSDQHKEIAALNARLGQYEQENGQLKSMLLGLLQAMEDGDGSLIDHTVRDMENRVGRLIGVPESGLGNLPDADMAAHETPADGSTDEPPVGIDLLDDTTGEDADPISGIAPEDVMIEDDSTLADVLDNGLIALDDDLVEVAEAGVEDNATAADSVEEPDFAADKSGADDAAATVAEAEPGVPEPETVTLDDAPEQGDTVADDDELAASAHNLLDRVEAAANALLAAGADDDSDALEHELSDEISALLERAVNGTSDEMTETGETAEVMLAEEATADAMDEVDAAVEGNEGSEDVKANAA